MENRLILKKITIIMTLIIFTSCGMKSSKQNQKRKEKKIDTLYRYTTDKYYEPGSPCGYKDIKGEIIFPEGKYNECFSKYFIEWAAVSINNRTIGINKDEKELFEIYSYDNSIDYFENGLFRIIKDSLIGFANGNAKIVIPAIYKGAFPFKNGKAKVSFNCQASKKNNIDKKECVTWFYIDKKGNTIN